MEAPTEQAAKEKPDRFRGIGLGMQSEGNSMETVRPFLTFCTHHSVRQGITGLGPASDQENWSAGFLDAFFIENLEELECAQHAWKHAAVDAIADRYELIGTVYGISTAQSLIKRTDSPVALNSYFAYFIERRKATIFFTRPIEDASSEYAVQVAKFPTDVIWLDDLKLFMKWHAQILQWVARLGKMIMTKALPRPRECGRFSHI